MQSAATDAGHEFYRRVARHARLSFVDLDEQTINPLAARLLSEQLARAFLMLPISYANGIVTIASPEPPQEVAKNTAMTLTGRSVEFVIAPADQLRPAIDEAFGLSGWEETGAAPTPVTDLSFPTRVGDLLVARGLATDEQIAEALREQERTGSRLGDVLVHSGVVSEPELVAILAEQFQLPLVELSDYEPDPAALELIPHPLPPHRLAAPTPAPRWTPSPWPATCVPSRSPSTRRRSTSRSPTCSTTTPSPRCASTPTSS